MNRRARELGLEHTHYGNPIGLDEPGAHSSAHDLVKLALFLRTKPFFRRTVKQDSVTLTTGAVPRTLQNRNTLIGAVPWVNGVKTGHTQQAGGGAGRIRPQARDPGDLGGARREGQGDPQRRHGAPAAASASASSSGSPPRPSTRRVGVRVPIRYRRGAELELVVGPNGERTVVPRGQRNLVTIRPIKYPTEVQGPIPYGTRLGMAEVLQDGHRIATVPLIGNAEVPDAGLAQRTKSWFTTPIGVVLAFAGAERYGALGTATARLARIRPTTGTRGGPGRMIITVTLNTAIDKTLSVPNFRLGRRHRTVEQTTMPGGKGVNVARVLKTLGAPVIATGLTGGATGTRIVDQLTQLSVLSDFVRIREESRTNTAVIDPTTGEQTEINERGPKVSEQEAELFVDKLLYLAKGASMCVFAGSLPRDVDIDVYARLIRELRRLGVSTSSTPTATRCAARCAPSRT